MRAGSEDSRAPVAAAAPLRMPASPYEIYIAPLSTGMGLALTNVYAHAYACSVRVARGARMHAPGRVLLLPRSAAHGHSQPTRVGDRG